MRRSLSVANQIHRCDLAVAGAQNYSRELPKETGAIATTLEGKAQEVRSLAAKQEKAKQDLALLTQQLGNSLSDSRQLSAKIVRLAEVTFGPRHPRIREFRPATEGMATPRLFVRHTAPALVPATNGVSKSSAI